jgi:hypothetical protein
LFGIDIREEFCINSTGHCGSAYHNFSLYSLHLVLKFKHLVGG